MQILKGLVTSTLFAQAKLRVEVEGEKAKQANVTEAERKVATLAEPLKRSPKKKAGRTKPRLNKVVKKAATRKEAVHY